jgi:hypothetical protein
MLTPKEKVALVERALYEGLEIDEGAKLLATESWVQLMTPGAATRLQNQVLRAVLAKHEADARIASTIAAYRALA